MIQNIIEKQIFGKQQRERVKNIITYPKRLNRRG